VACYAPDVITVPQAEWPEAETGTSRETLRHQFEQTKAPWEEERVEVDEIRDLGDRVLALYRWIGRGKGSHAEVEHPIATLHTLRGGRIVRIDYFLDQSEALRASAGAARTRTRPVVDRASTLALGSSR
jgi:ketosteroid isomerase-like protein